jgi:two-component system response regulator FixJ
MKRAIIYVVDDNDHFRESTEWMLKSIGYQVKGFKDPVLALKKIEQSYPNANSCCLLDIKMPSLSGLEFHDRLISKNIQIPIIYMSGHGDIPLVVETMNKGAITFLEKPLNNRLLKTAIKKAFNQSYKNDVTIRVNGQVNQNLAYVERLDKLTVREREVLEEIVAGKMNKVIAIDLGISVKTVELHRSRVMSKMMAKTAADLVKMVITRHAANHNV